MKADLQIELTDASPTDLAEAIGRQIAGDPVWSRDGILEHQVSTQEDVQYCFRHEPGGERPRTALCLAGTAETMTVATVVPIDRGVELDDEQYEGVVREFYEEVLEEVGEEIEVEIKKRY